MIEKAVLAVKALVIVIGRRLAPLPKPTKIILTVAAALALSIIARLLWREPVAEPAVTPDNMPEDIRFINEVNRVSRDFEESLRRDALHEPRNEQERKYHDAVMDVLRRRGLDQPKDRGATTAHHASLAADGLDLIPVPTTVENLDRFVAFANADDPSGTESLVLRGDMFRVPSGTRIGVIEAGLVRTKVEILEGEYAGRSGYVPSEWVKY